MTKALIAALNAQDDVSFHQLEHHLTIARMIRNTIIREGLTEKQMTEILAVSVKKMKALVSGGYPYDFMLLARLQAYQEKRAAADAQLKIKAQDYRVATDLDQLPQLVEKVTRLLKAMGEDWERKEGPPHE